MTQEKNILDPIVLTQLRQALTSWQEQELATFTARQPESKQEYRSASGLLLERVYTALDAADTLEAGKIT
jgi:hypothetical protein